jgi:hypothetical protein
MFCVFEVKRYASKIGAACCWMACWSGGGGGRGPGGRHDSNYSDVKELNYLAARFFTVHLHVFILSNNLHEIYLPYSKQ